MRNIYLLLLLLMVSSTLYAQDRFYVYQKDGLVQSFFCDQVDSITYSLIDAEGITQADFVTQLIYLPDSTVAIPLSVIDSVSFRDPEVVYQKDVVILDNDFLQYLLEVKEYTILYVSSSISNALLPTTGEILFYAYPTQLLPNGFAGRVTGITKVGDRWQITTTIPSMFEVYERLILAETFGSNEHNNLRVDFNKTMNLPFEYAPMGLDGNLALTVYSPNLPIINFDKTLKYFYLMFDCGIKLSATINKELEKGFDESVPLGPQLSIPLPNAVTGAALSLKIDPAVYVGMNGKMDINCSLNQQIRRRFGIAFHEGQWIPFCHPVNFIDSKPSIDAKIALDGSVFLGLQAGVGVGLTFGNEYTGLRGRIGPQLSANISFTAGSILNPSTFYSENKESKIGTEVNWSISSALPKTLVDLLDNAGLQSEWTPLGDAFAKDYSYVLPIFTQPKVIFTNESSADVQITSTVSRKVYIEPTVGLALYKGKDLIKVDGVQRYKSSELLLGANFQGLEEQSSFLTVPVMELFGMTFLGDQETTFTTAKEVEPGQPSSLLIGKWSKYDGLVETFVYEFDEQGRFSWTIYDPEAEGGIDVDSTYGTYSYDDNTHVLTMFDAPSGESYSMKIQLTLDTLIFDFGDYKDIYQRMRTN